MTPWMSRHRRHSPHFTRGLWQAALTRASRRANFRVVGNFLPPQVLDPVFDLGVALDEKHGVVDIVDQIGRKVFLDEDTHLAATFVEDTADNCVVEQKIDITGEKEYTGIGETVVGGQASKVARQPSGISPYSSCAAHDSDDVHRPISFSHVPFPAGRSRFRRVPVDAAAGLGGLEDFRNARQARIVHDQGKPFGAISPWPMWACRSTREPSSRGVVEVDELQPIQAQNSVETAHGLA